jgi:hypothetical protein
LQHGVKRRETSSILKFGFYDASVNAQACDRRRVDDSSRNHRRPFEYRVTRIIRSSGPNGVARIARWLGMSLQRADAQKVGFASSGKTAATLAATRSPLAIFPNN